MPNPRSNLSSFHTFSHTWPRYAFLARILFTKRNESRGYQIPQVACRKVCALFAFVRIPIFPFPLSFESLSSWIVLFELLSFWIKSCGETVHFVTHPPATIYSVRISNFWVCGVTIQLKTFHGDFQMITFVSQCRTTWNLFNFFSSIFDLRCSWNFKGTERSTYRSRSSPVSSSTQA